MKRDECLTIAPRLPPDVVGLNHRRRWLRYILVGPRLYKPAHLNPRALPTLLRPAPPPSAHVSAHTPQALQQPPAPGCLCTRRVSPRRPSSRLSETPGHTRY